MDQNQNQVDMWAVVELMGHGRSAGMIRTSDLGGLLRVDVPVEDGFRTEYYGAQAIYSIKVVSEEIARAYARPERGIYSYDEPIVPRAQYEEALRLTRQENEQAQRHIEMLTRRLAAINNALPDRSTATDPDESLGYTPEEEARINEHEMWHGPRPSGRWA